jgi:hypothetical protein
MRMVAAFPGGSAFLHHSNYGSVAPDSEWASSRAASMPRRTDHAASPPNSSRQDHRRRVTLGQRELVGEAHRTTRLVRDGGPQARRLADADFGGGDLADKVLIRQRRACCNRLCRRGARRRRLAGEVRQCVLDRLKIADRPVELHARHGVLQRPFQCALVAARHLHGPHRRPQHLQRPGVEARRRHRPPARATWSNGSPGRHWPGLSVQSASATSAMQSSPACRAGTATCCAQRAKGTSRVEPATRHRRRSRRRPPHAPAPPSSAR